MSPRRLPKGTAPFLFAYDIGCERRARRVRRTLKRWRVGGQLSVHETLLRPVQVRELAAELTGLVDRDRDAMLLGRLSPRGDGPVYHWGSGTLPVAGATAPRPIPAQLHGGVFLLAYDVRCERRLQRVQRLVARHTVYLQRSLYLFEGGGGALGSLLASTTAQMRASADDFRLYPLASKRDLWFLAGQPPLGGTVGSHGSPWRRLWNWLFAGAEVDHG